MVKGKDAAKATKNTQSTRDKSPNQATLSKLRWAEQLKSRDTQNEGNLMQNQLKSEKPPQKVNFLTPNNISYAKVPTPGTG